MGRVGGNHRLNEGLLHRILPFVTEGLKSRIQDYQVHFALFISLSSPSFLSLPCNKFTY